ncbi:hypothetical protein MRB53_038029 [Persea americana]|nr:hypothetical protein MRB53_038029 [Persea americana]
MLMNYTSAGLMRCGEEGVFDATSLRQVSGWLSSHPSRLRWHIRDLISTSSCSVALNAQGLRPGSMEWQQVHRKASGLPQCCSTLPQIRRNRLSLMSYRCLRKVALHS